MAGKHRFRRLATLGEALGRRARPTATTSGCTISFADRSTGIAHRISAAEAFAADHRAGEPYLARCGRPVLRRTPLQVVPQGPRCPACVAGSAR